VTTSIGGASAILKTLEYAGIGVQLAGRCSSDCTNEDPVISSIALGDPFVGVDANGLGIGSTQGEFETALGPGGAPDENGVVVYNNSSSIGVTYKTPSTASCEPQAVFIVMNYDHVLSPLLFRAKVPEIL
jgi:hypothetical protein